MFKNRSIQVSLANNDKTPSEPRQVDRDAVVYWNAVLIANAQNAAVGFVAIYAAVKFIDTVSKVAIIKATAELA